MYVRELTGVYGKRERTNVKWGIPETIGEPGISCKVEIISKFKKHK